MSVATLITTENLNNIWTLVEEGKIKTAMLEGVELTLVTDCFYTRNGSNEDVPHTLLYGHSYDEKGEVSDVFPQDELLGHATVEL